METLMDMALDVIMIYISKCSLYNSCCCQLPRKRFRTLKGIHYILVEKGKKLNGTSKHYFIAK